uniref:Uncharacterized protein n=1 Tax=Micrurus lemniscatus lemniscatus TaxID=129467 RepID=A0A2D4I9C1_MICLE
MNGVVIFLYVAGIKCINAVGSLELDWIFSPGTDGIHHCIHIQSTNNIVLFKSIFNLYLILGLKEVILMDHTAVGQRLREFVSQGGLPAIRDPADAEDDFHGIASALASQKVPRESPAMEEEEEEEKEEPGGGEEKKKRATSVNCRGEP